MSLSYLTEIPSEIALRICSFVPAEDKIKCLPYGWGPYIEEISHIPGDAEITDILASPRELSLTEIEQMPGLRKVVGMVIRLDSRLLRDFVSGENSIPPCNPKSKSVLPWRAGKVLQRLSEANFIVTYGTLHYIPAFLAGLCEKKTEGVFRFLVPSPTKVPKTYFFFCWKDSVLVHSFFGGKVDTGDIKAPAREVYDFAGKCPTTRCPFTGLVYTFHKKEIRPLNKLYLERALQYDSSKSKEHYKDLAINPNQIPSFSLLLPFIFPGTNVSVKDASKLFRKSGDLNSRDMCAYSCLFYDVVVYSILYPY